MQNGLRSDGSKRILHIENWTEAANVFVQELHAGTGAIIEHACTLEEGLRKIEQGGGSVDIVLYTIAPSSCDPLAFSDRVRALADDALFRYPQLVLLASAPLALPSAAKCMDRQVVYLLRDYPVQIIEIVRTLLWRIRASRPGPTICIEFRRGHYRFFLCGAATSEEIVLSRQVGKLLLLLSRGMHTVDALAEELEVEPQTIKKYMLTLRLIVGSLQSRLNTAEPNVDFVWMQRGPGGTICGLRANFVWS